MARTQTKTPCYRPLISRLPSSLALPTWEHVEVLNAAGFHDPCVEANSKHTSEACWPGSTVDHNHGSCKMGWPVPYLSGSVQPRCIRDRPTHLGSCSSRFAVDIVCSKAATLYLVVVCGRRRSEEERKRRGGGQQ